MRYELYSLACKDCAARNEPTAKKCVGCGGALAFFRRCSRCQQENPPNAYVCLKCYSVLQQKPSVGMLHWHIPWTVSFVVLTVVVGYVAFSLAKQWFAYTEAQIEANAVAARQLEVMHRDYAEHEGMPHE